MASFLSSNPFCLGMCEWTDYARNSALGESSTSTSGPSPASLSAPPRFSEFVSDDELSKLSKGLIPKNTAKNTKWAFEEWENARNNFQKTPYPTTCLHALTLAF